MAIVSVIPSAFWNYGLPPYLPGLASNLGAVVDLPTSTSWVINWVGPNAFALDMRVVLGGVGLGWPVGANLPTSGTITSFTLYVEGNPVLFDISGLSIAAADFAAAVAANRLSEILLAGDDSFGILASGSAFGDGLRLRGYDGDDLLDFSALPAFTGFELLGDAGDDTLIGSNDVFNTDTLDGGSGDDLLRGVAGSDRLFGGEGEDSLYGGNQNDTLTGGLGRDILRGDGGDDVIIVTLDSQHEGEILDGGTDTDILLVSGDTSSPPQVIDLTATQVTGFERLHMQAADTLLTLAQYQQFTEFELFGPVTLRFADAGFITLAERAWFADPNTLLVRVAGSDGGDTIIGRGRADVATGSAPPGAVAIGPADWIDGGGGNDRIFGAGGSDTLLGGLGNDTLRGEAGGDSLEGGAGNDVLVGGAAADVLIGNGGLDTASYETSGRAVTASLASSAANTGDAAGDSYSGIENLRGGTAGDRLTGNTGANLIEGMAGYDILNGAQGNDTLFGGAGADTLRGSTGVDVLQGGADGDTFQFATFADSSIATPDLILDFVSGTDRISVAAVIPGVFVFNGTGTFSGGGVASVIYAPAGLGDTNVLFDFGNGGAAEMVIRLAGTQTLTSSDFLL